MRRITILIASVVIGTLAGTIAEGVLAPLLKSILTGPRDGVVIHWLGTAVGVVAGIIAFDAIRARRPAP